MKPIDAVAASGMVSSATLAALVSMLKRKHLISAQDEREIYEHALMLLEMDQGRAPEMARITGAAREVIEAQLRGDAHDAE
jgi:hypothetical protein